MLLVFRCERLSSCLVAVSPATLGDSCPDTPKYLEVHYYCREEELPTAAISSRPSPQFPDTELTALWNQHGHKVNIDSVLQAMKERPPDGSSDKPAAERVPITTVAAIADDGGPTTESPPPASTTRPGPRIQFAVSETESTTTEGNPAQRNHEMEAVPDQAWLVNNHTAQLRRQEVEEVTEDEDGYKDKAEDNGLEEGEESGRVNTMFVLEVVTYAVASVCGVIIVFLILKVRKRFHTCYLYKTVIC